MAPSSVTYIVDTKPTQIALLSLWSYDVDKKDNQVTNGLVVGVNVHIHFGTMSPNRDKWLNTAKKAKYKSKTNNGMAARLFAA